MEVLGIRSCGSDVTRGMAFGSYGWKGNAWGGAGVVVVVLSTLTSAGTPVTG